MLMRKSILAASLLALLCSLGYSAEPSWNTETPAQRDARLQWWRDARFGLFIHWGLYAIPAGKWEGKDVPSIGEWIMNNANIPVDQYEKLAGRFNPVKFDAVQWAKTARQAGVKYLVITSKHHDGFCLFGTKATKYNVVDGTPYKKDLLKPLAEACRNEGIKFCTYYSIMDWHHPAQYRADEKKYNPTKIHAERKKEYVDFMKQQLAELIQEVDTEMLWFDGEWPAWWTEEDGRDLYKCLRALKPSLLINNRIGKGRKGMEGLTKGDYVGDFGTPEQQIPATGIPGVDWESCMTMNDTWGFKSDDHKWKSAETLTRNLIDIASKGGNYLLNVGPTAAGEIPAASIERLQAMGRWMRTNGESIYGTQSSPFKRLPWGRCTRKTGSGGTTTLYLHVFDWPADGKLVVPGLNNEITAARLLADPKKAPLATRRGENNWTVTLPAAAPDKIASVVVLQINGAPDVESIPLDAAKQKP